MRSFIQRCTLLFLAVVLAGAAGCTSLHPSTVGRTIYGVENFDQVDDVPRVIYRGAQPTRDGFATLRTKYQVKTVIDLRGDAESWEPLAVRQAGMTYHNIPSYASESAADKERHVREFLHLVTRAEAPIFVHCRQGRDRTGLEVAAYQVAIGKRKNGEAIKELRAHGYNEWAFPQIAEFVRTMKPADYRPVIAGTDVAPSNP